MLWDLRVLTLVLSFFATAGLAYPTWWLGAYNFRCKSPSFVESTTSDWNGEWRVSSICAPGTCCSNWASTGPLCTAEACGIAEKERAQLLTQHNNAEAARKSKQKLEEEREKARKEKEAEEKWKAKEKELEAARMRQEAAEKNIKMG